MPEESLPDEPEKPSPPNVPTTDKDLEPSIPQHDPRLVGIRGWLIVPAIVIGLSLIVGPFSLISGFTNMSSVDAVYTVPAFIVGTVFYIWIWVAAIRFFKKRSTAVRTLIQLMLTRIVASVCLFILGMVVYGDSDELKMIFIPSIVTVFSSFIWILYLKKSKRVKATFRN